MLDNANNYEGLAIKPIVVTIQTHQLKWFGHIMRRDENTTIKKAVYVKVKGGRHRERAANILAKGTSTPF